MRRNKTASAISAKVAPCLKTVRPPRLFQREASLIKYGSKQVATSVGSPGMVEFDWMAFDEYRRSLDHFDPRQAAFYHVHPPGYDRFSALDDDCIKGFTRALGYQVKFGIILFADDDLGSVDHREILYPAAVAPIAPELDRNDLFLLKALAYSFRLRSRETALQADYELQKRQTLARSFSFFVEWLGAKHDGTR